MCIGGDIVLCLHTAHEYMACCIFISLVFDFRCCASNAVRCCCSDECICMAAMTGIHVGVCCTFECFGVFRLCKGYCMQIEIKKKKRTNHDHRFICFAVQDIVYITRNTAMQHLKYFLSVQHSVGRAVNYSIINIIVNNLFVASSLCRVYVTIATKTTLLNIFEDDAQNIAASACDATAAPSHPSHGTAATTAYQCQCRTTDEYGHEYAATATAPTECDASSASSAAATATPPALSSNHQ